MAPDEGVCLSALYTCSFGPHAVPHLVAELGRDPGTDEIPENMLSDGGLAEAALPALENVLEEGGYRAQSAARVLERIARESEDVETCLGELRSGDSGGRWQAVSCLAPYVKNEPRARQAVLRALRDPSVDVREVAASSLGAAGKEAIPALVAALGDQGGVVREAARSLGQIGADAIPAVTAALLDRRSSKRRVGAVSALAAIGPPALPTLIDVLEDPTLRVLAADAIAEMGPPAAPAVPALAAALETSNPPTRGWILRAISAVGHEAGAAVPAVTRALDYEDHHTRVAAAATLGAIGPAATAAIPRLSAMARDASLDRQIRLNCEIALRKIQRPQ